MISILAVALLLLQAPGGTQAAQTVRMTDAAAATPGLSMLTASKAALVHNPLAQPPKLLKGWPKSVKTSFSFATTRGLVFEDLDGDGKQEIIRSYCNPDNRSGSVYVWRHDGSIQKGWPQQTIGMAQYVPTLADLDGDGRFEIIVTTRGLTRGGRLYVFRDDGSLMPGWPKSLNGNNVSQAATAADLDGDGRLEIIAQERAYPKGKIHVFRFDGRAFPGTWPATIDHVPTMTPSVGDLDGDGKPEIVVASYNSLYCFSHDGKLVPGWPYDVKAKHNANFSYQSPALGDLTGDGKLEIVVCTHKTGAGCFVFNAAGKLLPGWPKSFAGRWSYCAPTLVDLDGDGKLDILAARDTQIRNWAAIWAWKSDGSVLPGFPVSKFGGAQAPLTVADIDGDGKLEFFADSSYMNNGQGFLHCYDSAGRLEPGFPLRVPGFTYMNGASIGDVDGDGDLEIGVIVRTRSSSAGGTDTIYLYEMPGPTTPPVIRWKGYKGHNARRGRVHEADRFATSGQAKPGGLLRLEFQGPARSVGLAFLGTRPSVLPLPGLGILRLDPRGPILPLVSTPLSKGRAVLALPIPQDPGLRGATIWLQGLNVAVGKLRLDELRVFRIR